MLIMPATELIPIRTDEQGRLRVGNTRVLLDLVVYSYLQGDTPETIIDQYPSLSLDDLYLAIGYYLRHRTDIDDYIRREDEQASQFEQEWRTTHPPTLSREMLLARLAAQSRATRKTGE